MAYIRRDAAYDVHDREEMIMRIAEVDYVMASRPDLMTPTSIVDAIDDEIISSAYNDDD